MRPSNPILMQALDASATVYSNAIPGDFILYGSAQAVFSSGTLGGAFKLQCSNDSVSNLPAGEAPQNWTDIPNTSQTVTSGATALIPSLQVTYKWIRAAWVPSTGTGTITATGLFQGAN
jgi:hypothetical protein